MEKEQIVFNKKNCFECRTFIVNEFKSITINQKAYVVHLECFNQYDKELKKLSKLTTRVEVDPSKSLSKRIGRPKNQKNKKSSKKETMEQVFYKCFLCGTENVKIFDEGKDYCYECYINKK